MNSKLLARVIGGTLFALAACSPHGATGMLPLDARSHVALRAKTAALLYVSDPSANAVLVYHATGTGAPIATITQGIDGPAGLTVDDSGDLFVANTAGNTVTEYAPNASSASVTYSKGVLGPVDVAVDGSGTVYVANFYSFAASIVEFPAGSQMPSVTITDPCSCYPVGLTLDAENDLYVAYDDYYEQTIVYEYVAGSSAGKSLTLTFGQFRWETAGLAFDAHANLVVADATRPGIEIFPPGDENPSKVFGGRGKPRFVAFDRTENSVFVSDTANNTVEEYGYPSGRMMHRITNGLKSAYGVAVSPRAPL